MKKFIFNTLYYALLPMGCLHTAITCIKYGCIEWEDSPRPWTYMFVQTHIINFVEE